MNNRTQRVLGGSAGDISVTLRGDVGAPAVVMTHSILASGLMWKQQADLLASRGFRVICPDTRGHGASQPGDAPYTLDELGGDTLRVLDELQVARAHYVGLSLGAMSGFGLGIHHVERLSSLCLCSSPANAPSAYVALWDQRVEVAQRDGCKALAAPTIERWFGKAFAQEHPDVAARFRRIAAATSTTGFVGCARAIQKLAYLDDLARITSPTTLIVGANDGDLPQAMQHIQTCIPGAALELIPGAGHLPNIDQPEAFNQALLRHFERLAVT